MGIGMVLVTHHSQFCVPSVPDLTANGSLTREPGSKLQPSACLVPVQGSSHLGANLSIISLYLFLTNQDKGLVMRVEGEKNEPGLGNSHYHRHQASASVQWKATQVPSQVSPGANIIISQGGGRGAVTTIPGPHSGRQEPNSFFIL